MARTVDKAVELVYDHRSRIKNRSRPLWKCDEYRAISVFWEIGGVKAHCLMNSSCKGVMIWGDDIDDIRGEAAKG